VVSCTSTPGFTCFYSRIWTEKPDDYNELSIEENLLMFDPHGPSPELLKYRVWHLKYEVKAEFKRKNEADGSIHMVF
jgi:hypothetical protein